MDKAIKKIVLDLGGKEVTLTPKQAQNLKNALDELFGKEIVKVIEKEFIKMPDPYPVPVPYPAPYHRRPYWEYEHPRFGEITCKSSLDGDTLKLTG